MILPTEAQLVEMEQRAVRSHSEAEELLDYFDCIGFCETVLKTSEDVETLVSLYRHMRDNPPTLRVVEPVAKKRRRA